MLIIISPLFTQCKRHSMKKQLTFLLILFAINKAMDFKKVITEQELSTIKEGDFHALYKFNMYLQIDHFDAHLAAAYHRLKENPELIDYLKKIKLPEIKQEDKKWPPKMQKLYEVAAGNENAPSNVVLWSLATSKYIEKYGWLNYVKEHIRSENTVQIIES